MEEELKLEKAPALSLYFNGEFVTDDQEAIDKFLADMNDIEKHSSAERRKFLAECEEIYLQSKLRRHPQP